jgi:hypothetical protein
MTEENKKPNEEKDSLGMDVKKSPWLIFALLQIPIVIGMIIFIFIMYNQSQNQ